MAKLIETSSYARYIGRVGALAVALGVGVAVATGQGVGTGIAWAQDDSGSNENAPSGGGQDTSGADPAGGDEGGAPGGSDNNTGGADGASGPSDTGMNVGSSGGVDTSTNDGGQSTDTGDADEDEQDSGAVDANPTTEPTTPAAPPVNPTPTATPTPTDPAPATPNPAPQNNANPTAPTGSPTSNPAGSAVDPMTGNPSGPSTSTPPTGSPTVAPLSFAPSGGSANMRTFSAPADDDAHFSTLADTPAPAAGLPGAIINVASSIFTALLSPFLGNGGPSTPAEPPFIWALLAVARRQLGTLSNKTPKAVADNVTTSEDVAKVITVLANDTDDDPLTIASVTQPTNGTVTINPDGTLKYVPKANWSGTDTFTYTVTDATAGNHVHGFLNFSKAAHQSTARVTVTVTAVNDAPVATGGSYTVAEDGTLTVPKATGVLVGDTDVDNTAAQLKAVLGAGPAHGTVALADDGSFVYTPAANYSGPDSFTYKTSDGIAQSAPATITINVTPVNDAPVANPDSYSTNENTPLTIAAPGVLGNDGDIDSATLKATVVAGPAHGSLALNDNGSFTYTPNANYSGGDSFTYKVNDGTVDGNTATVSITVNEAAAAQTGPLIVGEPIPQNGYVNGVLVTPDGKRLLQQTSSYDSATNRTISVLTLVDVETGAVIGEPATFNGYNYGNAYLDDRRVLTFQDYSGSRTTTFVVIDTATGEILGEPVVGPGQMYPRFNEDESRALLVFDTYDGTPKKFVVVSTESGEVLGEPIYGNVYGGQLNDDPTRAYVMRYDETSDTTEILVVDTDNGQLLGDPIVLDGQHDYVQYSPEFTRAYTYAYSTSRGTGTLAVLDTEAGGLVGTPIVLHEQYLYLQFNGDETTAAFASRNNNDGMTTVTVLDVVNGQVIGTPVKVEGGSTSEFVYSDDGSRLFATTYNSYYETNWFTVINTGNGEIVGETIQLHGGNADVEFNADGTRAYVISHDTSSYYYPATSLRIVNTETGEVLSDPITVTAHYYTPEVQFSDDGTRAILSGWGDNTGGSLYVVNTDTGDVVLEKTGGVNAYSYTAPDGTRVYLSNFDNVTQTRTIEIFDTANGARVGDPIMPIAGGLDFTDDGKRMYIIDVDDDYLQSSVQILDAKTGDQIGDTFRIDGNPQNIISTSDGRYDLIRGITYEEGTSFDRGTSRVYIIDTATGAPTDSFTFQAGYGELKLTERGDRIYVTGLSKQGYFQNVWSTTVAVVDADTGTVLGTPIQLDGSGDTYFSEDGTRLYLRTYTSDYNAPFYERERFAVIDTATGQVGGLTARTVGAQVITNAPGGRTIVIQEVVNSLGTPDLSAAQTNITVGGDVDDVQIQISGLVQKTWYSADQKTMYVQTLKGQYTGTTIDPATATSYLVAIDIATGTIWQEGSVASDGFVYNDFNYDGRGVIVGDDHIYMTTVVTREDGSRFTRTTVADRVTGAVLGTVDQDGGPTRFLTIANGEGHVVQVSESTDSAGVKATTLSLIDTATGARIGDPIEFDAAMHTVLFTEDGSQFVVVTQPGKFYISDNGPGEGPSTLFSGPTTFTLFDAATGEVVGEPLVVDGTFTYWTARLGENGDRAVAQIVTHDAETDTDTNSVVVIDIDGTTAAA